MHKFQHTTPRRPEYQPHRHNTPEYGNNIEYAEAEDATPPLDKDEIKELMGIVGSLILWGRAIYNTMLTALSDLAAAQAKGNKATQEAAKKPLNSCATYPNPTISFQGIQMALKVHSDASYLSAPKARSRAGGNLFIGKYSDASNPNIHNGTLVYFVSIIKHVVSSAAEAETGTLFINMKEEEVIIKTLEYMGWHQRKPIPIATNNSTAVRIANDTINKRRSKVMDMRFYWY